MRTLLASVFAAPHPCRDGERQLRAKFPFKIRSSPGHIYGLYYILSTGRPAGKGEGTQTGSYTEAEGGTQVQASCNFKPINK